MSHVSTVASLCAGYALLSQYDSKGALNPGLVSFACGSGCA